MMNSRELVIVSTATIFGALASAITFRFLINPRKPSSSSSSSSSSSIDSSSSNGALDNSSKPDPFDPSKREGYLSWDDYFMGIAFLSAKRSKDPNRQVGACLVSKNGVILGIGYNGFPRGCSDDKLPWAKKSINGDPLETKYPYVCHAEVNAILNTNHASATGQRLYVTMFPCNECAKIIIQDVFFTSWFANPMCALGAIFHGDVCHLSHDTLSGVSEVIYFVEKRFSNPDTAYIASHRLLSMAGVKVRKHQPQMSQILVKFEEP